MAVWMISVPRKKSTATTLQVLPQLSLNQLVTSMLTLQAIFFNPLVFWLTIPQGEAVSSAIADQALVGACGGL